MKYKTIEDILKTKTLEEWCSFYGWQGGTIHQVKKELKYNLIRVYGCIVDKDGLLCTINYES